MKSLYLAVASVAAITAANASAQTAIVINPGVQAINTANGTVYAYDAVGERGGLGYTGVTTTAPRAAAGTPGANGSLEIHGDRSRYVIGSIYENFAGAPAVSISRLADIQSLLFDWQTANATASQIHAAPVVRLHIMDNGIRSEMIWEQVYNGGTAGVAAPSGWQTSSASDVFYLNVRDNDGAAFLAQNSGVSGLSIEGASSGQGVVYLNGGQFNNTITGWQSLFSSNASITGFSFGAGSGFGNGFVGFLDNVRINKGTAADSVIVNFEATAPVPEPATWAMMILGMGGIGYTLRRRSAKVAIA
jgi:hypothetical protein